MILSDIHIRNLCIWKPVDGYTGTSPPFGWKPLLDPFIEGRQGDDIISCGLSHAGYDLRLGRTVLIFKNSFNEIIDPKRFKNDPQGTYHSRIFDKVTDIADNEAVMIPPGGYILGNSMERICMPSNLKGTCVGKSTLARCGVGINTTPLEPGWEGYLTLEIANHTPCPIKVYVGEGIAQLEFHTLSSDPGQTYDQKGEKGGKYQNQGEEPVPARVVGNEISVVPTTHTVRRNKDRWPWCPTCKGYRRTNTDTLESGHFCEMCDFLLYTD